MPPRIQIAQTIPAEIVQEIFAPFSTAMFLSNGLSRFPWFLGHICSGWRSVFLSMTAEFWCSISISFDRDNYDRRRAQTENFVQFFLERGRDCATPLSITFCLPRPLYEFSARAALHRLSILEMLVDESVRWHTAVLSVSDESDLLPLTRAANRFPLLQDLRLLCWGNFCASNLLHSVFETAPSLRVIDVQTPASWKFNWSNLKAVSLSSGILKPIRHLSQMTNLERLFIFDDFAGSIHLNSIAFLPKLTSLRCHPSWLPFLEAPSLQKLVIQDDYDNPDGILSFLHRSSCNITHLCLMLGEATAAVIVIIRHMPQITQLELSRVDNMNIILEQLVISTELARESLVPHMSSLGVNFFSAHDLSLLPGVIVSRTSVGDGSGYKRLQRLNISRPRGHVSRFALEDLIELCKERGVECTETGAL